MKKNNADALKVILIIVAIVLLTNWMQHIHWWIFVIPVIILGVIIALREWKVSAFPIGFLAGFIIWFGVNLYFDQVSNGIILNKIGLLLMMPKIVVMLIAGIIGGLVTGLALYTGKSIVKIHKNTDLKF
jgi:hypothetical protein